ncbi:kelch domain-containing protein 7A [Choloepus didactylus]|uniref:kelch domain-containing protein 7A n=1 Tax=Choloepus didactylus TaxID=27675 RepID=UPI00189FB35B|nr:kelch domain-containing protein 7A [Choloepus didactylus]
MLSGGAEAQAWHFDMQLTGKVVLFTTALLLMAAAYRLYKSRPARTPRGGGRSKAQAEEEAEGSGEPAIQAGSPRLLPRGPRRRKISQGAGAPLGCRWDNPGGSCVLATGTAPRDGEPRRKGAGEEWDGQCPDFQQVPPCRGGWGAGMAVGGKPDLSHCPLSGSESKCSPTGLSAVDGSCMDTAPAPWHDGRAPEQPAARELVSPYQRWTAHTEGGSDTSQSWVFSQVTGVSREEAGALQAASDMGLALHKQEGTANTSYTFSSMARVRVEENFIQETVEGTGPRLKGKVYNYYVESISQAVSRDRLRSRTAALAETPSPEPLAGPPGPGAASRGHADDKEGAAETAAAFQPVPAPCTQGFSRKDSLLQIVENPELQLQLDGFRAPGASGLDQGVLPTGPGSLLSLQASSAGSRGEPHVQLVAGANFFHLPLSPGSASDVHLDLGNCYQVLTLAKRQNLGALKEAAYKVMSDNYLQVLRTPDIYGCLSGAERERILQQRLQGRERLVVADICPQAASGRLCCYDDEQDAWHPLASLPPEAVSRGCAICSLFNYLFVVSGCQGPGRQPSNRVFCYNPLTGIWSEVCPLNQARPHCRLVALDGHLYAIGGECLNTVECYDPRLDLWALAPPLPSDTFALAHTAAACAGEIFVTGGSLRYLLLRFSAREQRWWAGPTGGGRDRTAEMAAVGGFLYRFDFNRSLGISVHRCGARARLWYECATFRAPYPAAFQCAVVDNRIYCVGRQRTLCFLADHVSPRFVPKELQSFPSPQGTLLPTVLTLPAPHVPQTRV